MEKELNIAAILKEKPKGTKLWSPIQGNCEFLDIVDKVRPIKVASKSGIHYFREDGKYEEDGEICLFPSKDMRDWEKFAWKTGEVLVNLDRTHIIIFDKWINDNYTKFKSTISYYLDEKYDNDSIFYTSECKKQYSWQSKKFIENLKRWHIPYLGTFEKEKQPEFKDGDIVLSSSRYKYIFIYKKENEYNNPTGFYVSLNNDGVLSYNNRIVDGKDLEFYCKHLRLATDSEKQQLFDALAKEGKRWNPDTKIIEDLPKECEFEPMDWCLMRDFGERWKLCQFGFFEEDDDFEGAPYNAVGGNWYNECIPYNEETKHLLGTTDEWKGGEE